MRYLRRALLATTVLSMALGVVFLVLPPAVGGDEEVRLPMDVAPSLPHIPASLPELAEDLVLANAFSPRRAPPATRYTPPEGTVESTGGVMADPPSDDAALGRAAPRLLGTVIGGRGRQALLQLDPFAGAPRLYAEGERDAGFRILSIAPREVVLSGPRGRMTVRLDPQEERP